jgi:N-methylhydantoinase A/oxoprolinase/acetone carboxylase beta subunit
MTKYTIGIDIGGTNTDAVLVNENGAIISFTKQPTTNPVYIGFKNAIEFLLEESSIAKENIVKVIIGTTHCTNALLQGKNLYKVGLIRIAGQRPKTFPPCIEWKNNLAEKFFVGCETIAGGNECDGNEISEFDFQECIEAINSLKDKGMEALAITGVFAPLFKNHENKVLELAKKQLSNDFPITISSEIGNIGIIERENATILNSSLKLALKKGFDEIQNVLNFLQINAQLYFTQNNGTLITLNDALNYPIKTISAGQTNSFIGATKLARINDAIVIDIGGTSSDAGQIKNGFPVRSIGLSEIAGIELNFPMPDVISIALGGGSIIKIDKEIFSLSTESVQSEMYKRAYSFGGEDITLTDIAITKNKIKNLNYKRKLEDDYKFDDILREVANQIEGLADSMNADKNIPIVIVGGGACLIEKSYFNREVIIPENYQIANAYGAALAEISETFDSIVDLTNRDEILNDIYSNQKNELLKVGVNENSIRVINKNIIPFHYMPGNLARVIMVSAGSVFI